MKEGVMAERMKNPAVVIPAAMEAIQALGAATYAGQVPAQTLALVHLRASQINGCRVCVQSGTRQAKAGGETEARLAVVAQWREATCFSDTERAALALTEAVTRLADQPDPVPDEIWDEVTQHYDEQEVAVLLLSIGLTNLYNRLNVPTRQVSATWS
jgi:AhpD family alkylhydroperoxidase